jgi:hypothetical protein
MSKISAREEKPMLRAYNDGYINAPRQKNMDVRSMATPPGLPGWSKELLRVLLMEANR